MSIKWQHIPSILRCFVVGFLGSPSEFAKRLRSTTKPSTPRSVDVPRHPQTLIIFFHLTFSHHSNKSHVGTWYEFCGRSMNGPSSIDSAVERSQTIIQGSTLSLDFPYYSLTIGKWWRLASDLFLFGSLHIELYIVIMDLCI
jgi:hypothetical protein